VKGKLASKASDVVAYRPKPMLSIDDRDLSSVKQMQVGKTYTFTVTAKVTEVRASDDDEYYDGPTNKCTRARLRITKITEK